MREFKDISEKNPFKVPENYFEDVKRKIIFSTVEETAAIAVKSRYRRLRPYFTVAASIAVLMILSFTAVYVFTNPKGKSALPEITISEFSDNYLNDIDNLTLEESIGAPEAETALIELNGKEIIDYLILENIDIYAIYEQL